MFYVCANIACTAMSALVDGAVTVGVTHTHARTSDCTLNIYKIVRGRGGMCVCVHAVCAEKICRFGMQSGSGASDKPWWFGARAFEHMENVAH